MQLASDPRIIAENSCCQPFLSFLSGLFIVSAGNKRASVNFRRIRQHDRVPPRAVLFDTLPACIERSINVSGKTIDAAKIVQHAPGLEIKTGILRDLQGVSKMR
jgi:hypothetical protein